MKSVRVHDPIQLSGLTAAWRALRENNVEAARSVLAGLPRDSPPVRNALAVCLLAEGEAETALEILRKLAIVDGCSLRREILLRSGGGF